MGAETKDRKKLPIKEKIQFPNQERHISGRGDFTRLEGFGNPKEALEGS